MNDFVFADLFSGIGGFRLALEKLGGKCSFSSEIDKHSIKTYNSWYGDEPSGDIRNIDAKTMPDFDVLAAGFPCQPFSIAGVSKKNSLDQDHGFECKSQGDLFFEIVRVVQEKKPRILFLENVKNLVRYNKGQAFKIILDTLDKEGYDVFYQIINSKHWVPQSRERVFIIGYNRDKNSTIINPFLNFKIPNDVKTIGSILEKNVDPKYTLSDHLWEYLQNYAKKQKLKGNGFGFGLISQNDTARTLSARYHKDGSEILISQKNKNPRRLTPRESLRLMGFPDDKPIVVSNTQAYRQAGNAVVVPVVLDVAKAMLAI